jgi:hypothetical protein
MLERYSTIEYQIMVVVVIVVVVVVAKIIVYTGDDNKEYFSFITIEALANLKMDAI